MKIVTTKSLQLGLDDDGRIRNVFLRSLGMWLPIKEVNTSQKLHGFSEIETVSDELTNPFGDTLTVDEGTVLERRWDKMKGVVRLNRGIWLQRFELLNFSYQSAQDFHGPLLAFRISDAGNIREIRSGVFAMTVPLGDDKTYIDEVGVVASVRGSGSLKADFRFDKEWAVLAVEARGQFNLIVSVLILTSMGELVDVFSIPLGDPEQSEATMGVLFAPSPGFPLSLHRDNLLIHNRPYWNDVGILFHDRVGTVSTQEGLGLGSRVAPTMLRIAEGSHCISPFANFVTNMKDLLTRKSNIMTGIHLYGASLVELDEAFIVKRSTTDISPECQVYYHRTVAESLASHFLHHYGLRLRRRMERTGLRFVRESIEISDKLDIRILLSIAAVARSRGAEISISSKQFDELKSLFPSKIRLEDVDHTVSEIAIGFRAEVHTFYLLRRIDQTSTAPKSVVPWNQSIEKAVRWNYEGGEEPVDEIAAIREALRDPNSNRAVVESIWRTVADMIRKGWSSTPKIVLAGTAGSKLSENSAAVTAALYSTRGNLPCPVIPFELTNQGRIKFEQEYASFTALRNRANFDSFVSALFESFPPSILQVILTLQPSRIIAFTEFPLEMMRIDGDFLGLKIPCGRIAARDSVELAFWYDFMITPTFIPLFPLRVLVIAPQYISAESSGANSYISEMLGMTKGVLESLKSRFSIQVSILDGLISRQELKDALLKEFDLVLYIGHAKTASLLDSNGEDLNSAEISRESPAALAILIGCETGVRGQHHRAVSEVFLASGVRNVIATNFKIKAETAKVFLANLLLRLLGGNQTVGEAVLYSRIYAHLVEVLPLAIRQKVPIEYSGTFMAVRGIVRLDETVKHVLSQILPEVNLQTWKNWESQTVPDSLFFTLFGDPDGRVVGGAAFLQMPR